MMRKWMFLFLAGTVFAGETRTWEVSKRDAMLDCEEASGVIVANDGSIRLGLETTTVRLRNEASAWCGCMDDSNKLLIGTGSGKIYRINGTTFDVEFDTKEWLVTALVSSGKFVYAATLPNGKIFRRSEGKWGEFAKVDVPNVWALGASADGTLYAAGGKPGRLFRVAEGAATLLYESDAEQIFSMQVLGKDDVLIGTANPAYLVNVKKRKGYVVYDFGEGEVKAVGRRGDAFYAAVNAKTGLLPYDALKALSPRDKPKKEYLFDPVVAMSDPITGKWEGKLKFEKLDVDAEVSVQLKNDAGKVTGTLTYEKENESFDVKGSWDQATETLKLEGESQGIGVKFELKASGKDKLEGKVTATFQGEDIQGTIEIQRTQKPDEPPEAQANRETPGGPPPARGLTGAVRSVVWKITASRSEALAELPSYITSMHLVSDGVFVGTNTSGRVYKVLDSRGVELHFDLRQNVVTGFVSKGEKIAALLQADRGHVALVGDKAATKGIYISKSLDAHVLSHWGQLNVRGKGPVDVRTRSANVARTEDQYSDWSEPVSKFPAQVASPKGRYLQFKVTLSDPAAMIGGVTIAYKNENQRPRIQDARVDYVPVAQPGEPLPNMAPPVGPSPRVGQSHSPVKRVSWQFMDPDGDVLVFRIYARPVGGTTWTLLTQDDLQLNQYLWSTEGMADGKYTLKIVASDHKSNLKEEALEGEFETDTVIVDNTAPVVKIESAKGATVSGFVEDKTSNVTRIEYQVDGGEWQAVMCQDGLFDSPKEAFQISIKGLKAGKHVVAVRGFDQEMNQGVSSVELDNK